MDVAVPEGRIVRRQMVSGRMHRVQTTSGTPPDLRVVSHRVRHPARLVHPVRLPPTVRVAPAVLHAAAWASSDELDFLRSLRRHHLPAPDQLQRPVRLGRLRYLDARWERQRVSAEIDGAHHRTVGAWDDDVLRTDDVVVGRPHGVLVLRFTTGNLRTPVPCGRSSGPGAGPARTG